MANQSNHWQRGIRPIPDHSYPGPITYDTKGPDTRFPPASSTFSGEPFLDLEKEAVAMMTLE
jgi:hypothetical protein